jgi:hypothetical protein
MKKIYNKPNIKVVHLLYAHALLSGSTFTEEVNSKRGLARETDFYDDEEETEDLRGWFQ